MVALVVEVLEAYKRSESPTVLAQETPLQLHHLKVIMVERPQQDSMMTKAAVAVAVVLAQLVATLQALMLVLVVLVVLAA
jgi:hypothetical protein